MIQFPKLKSIYHFLKYHDQCIISITYREINDPQNSEGFLSRWERQTEAPKLFPTYARMA